MFAPNFTKSVVVNAHGVFSAHVLYAKTVELSKESCKAVGGLSK